MTDSPNDADVAFIQALAELLRENDLTDLRVKREYGEADSLDVRVSRAGPPMAQFHAPPPQPQAAPGLAPVSPAASSGGEPQASDDPARHPGAVTSPMVGTAYLSPEPEADPFVETGSAVAEGQTLLIIEAMKTMNHIPAPRAGTVRRILVEDGAPVEFGAPLMIID